MCIYPLNWVCKDRVEGDSLIILASYRDVFCKSIPFESRVFGSREVLYLVLKWSLNTKYYSIIRMIYPPTGVKEYALSVLLPVFLPVRRK